MKKNAGFSLVELVVGLAIVAIVIALAVPAVISYQTKHGLQYATDELFADLQLARMRAARNNQPCEILFNIPGPDQYQINDLDNGGAFISTFRVSTLTKLRGGIRFINNSPNPADAQPLTRLRFLPQGMVDQANIVPAGSNSVFLTNQGNDTFFRVRVSLAGATSVDRWVPAQNRWR
jgi:prepilin-type N-terminal cleavage/methylation domain-containing protein